MGENPFYKSINLLEEKTIQEFRGHFLILFLYFFNSIIEDICLSEDKEMELLSVEVKPRNNSTIQQTTIFDIIDHFNLNSINYTELPYFVLLDELISHFREQHNSLKNKQLLTIDKLSQNTNIIKLDFLPQLISHYLNKFQRLKLRAAEITRTGIGLPAYYNDEVIIPALQNRGLTLEDARDYNIIGCVEPQKSGKTDGWHDAAFFNMCRPLELVFSNGVDAGVQVGPQTGDVTKMTSFEEFYAAYKTQMNYFIELMVNADNAIDQAHADLCPLPFLSSMVEDCIGRGKSLQEGGAVYNFTGPQGFGIANMADAFYAVKKLVFEEKSVTMQEFKEALEHNYGKEMDARRAEKLTSQVARRLVEDGKMLTAEDVKIIYETVVKNECTPEQKQRYDALLEKIAAQPKFGNDIPEVDDFARDVAYTYTKPLLKYRNPRGGQYQAGLYPVSANVPLGAQTGATPDGRLAFTPVADGVSPAAGRDVKGPTAAANSVSKLDHYIASNGTLFNMKFHPSALAGPGGLESFVALVRGYFDQKGSHMQFNVVSRETLRDAQKNPEKYKSLVVRVAGYSALFTTLSRSLQDDIINRTEQGDF